MSKNEKIILRYPNYQTVINQYLNLDEFKEKATETMHSKRVTITAFAIILVIMVLRLLIYACRNMLQDLWKVFHRILHLLEAENHSFSGTSLTFFILRNSFFILAENFFLLL